MRDDGVDGPETGDAALARGDFATARRLYEAELDKSESARAHHALAKVSLMLEDVDAALRHSEIAYRQYRGSGACRQAAAAAITVAAAHSWWANEPAVRGWLGRARRLLDAEGDCVERGYLEMARVGCDVQDVVALEASTAAALELARRFGDTDLEIRALADSGLALVSQGRATEGLARLDEALAAVVAGEVTNYLAASLACCAMLTACDRLGDIERASVWADAVLASSSQRWGSPPPLVLQGHCRLIYGTLLREQGRWTEAEAQMRRTLECTGLVHYRADACGRLALIRIGQGRLGEAAELLAGFEDRLEVAEAIGELHRARREPELGAATLRRALRELRTDRLSSAPLLCLLVAIEVERGELDAAARAADELRESAGATGVASVATLSELASARVATARGDDALAHFHAALTRLGSGQRPMLRAEIQLELAWAIRSTDPTSAVAEARASLATFERLGARRPADRAAALLRELGVRPRTPHTDDQAVGTLSRREREVLVLLAEGLPNSEIAARLFITPKTVEHHVGAVLSKLGVRNRAEAAAHAATLRTAATAL